MSQEIGIGLLVTNLMQALAHVSKPSEPAGYEWGTERCANPTQRDEVLHTIQL